jgi:type II secretory pathway pseudopilin PulG
LELMIAIGIIIVLGAILIAGMKSITTGSKANAAKMDLNNVRGMLAELEATAKDDYAYIKTGWIAPIVAPGQVKEGGVDREGTVVLQTAWVYQKMRSVPANRNVMAQLPADRLMKWSATTKVPQPPPNAGLMNPPNPTMAPAAVPILVDSWNNPIIFVPAQGMSGMTTGGVTYTVAAPFKSPDGRPFFASAGPDGDFTKGDDNVYSFEQ